MKPLMFAFIFVATTGSAFADPCHDRFTELLVNGNQEMGAVRIHITQEIVGGQTSVNYHHSDGEGNGMTEMLEPADSPWSLFLGDKMYMSTDKGENWKFINSFDAEKSRADMKSTLTNDAAAATGILCGEEEFDGTSHEVVEGTYASSMLDGAEIYNKYWVNKQTGWISKSYSHTKSTGFESKTTQVIESVSNLTLPKPE